MKKFLTLFLVVQAVLSLAQTPTITGYRASTLPNGTQLVMAIYSDGSRKQVSALPSDAVVARKGGTVRLPYAPEANATLNLSQFGSGKYFSPSFLFSVDAPTSGSTVAERKALGINVFNPWMLTQTEKQNLPFGDGQLDLGESAVHDTYQRRGIYELNLVDYEAFVYPRILSVGNTASDPGVKWVKFNIETSLHWARDSYSDAEWNGGAKNKTIIPESFGNGSPITLDQLNSSGQWDAEARVRILNRGKLLMKIVKAKSAKDSQGNPVVKVSWGASPFQGTPDQVTANNPNNIFLGGNGDVSHIGGINGQVTLNSHIYGNMNGPLYDDEDFTGGYFYNMNAEFNGSDYNDIFVSKLPATQNYPYLWSKLKVIHVLAREKGYIQTNWKRHVAQQGKRRPILRQDETWFEQQGVIDNSTTFDGRIPFAPLQNAIGGTETPKISKSPREFYDEYVAIRFLAGNDGGGYGFFLFQEVDAGKIQQAPSTFPELAKPLHYYTQLFQARNDLQFLEQWYTGSTLVEDPEVQIGQSGSWSAYDGVAAYNVDGGVQKPQKPCYMLRYKATSDGWRVVIVGGYPQGWTESRTDNIRVPGGGLNGNTFTVQLNGPSAQVFEFFVKNTDSNQSYQALFARNTNWERAGYASRVGVASTTTTPTEPTTTVAATLRFNFDSNNLLSFEATDDYQTLTFSGPGFPTAPNPDNIVVNANVAYSPGQLANQGSFTKQWRLYHTGSINVLATLTNGSTIAYTLTPAAGAYHVGLSGTQSNPTANNGTNSTNGTNSSSGSGTNTGSTTAYKPSAETYSYPTIVGSKTWPGYDNRVLTYQPSGITKAIGETATLDNGKIRVEVWKTYSGVAHVSKSGTGLNLVNQSHDNGRGIDLTLYLGGTVIQNPPKNIGPWGNGQPDGIGGAGVAYDPITTGDFFNNPSKTLDFTTDGQTIYLKTQLVNWNVDNDLTDVIVEKWIYLDDIACRVNWRITCNRAGEKQQYEARSNELPNFYADARLSQLAYSDGNGNIQWKTGGDGTKFTIGERWVFCSPDQNQNSQGVGLTRSGMYSTIQVNEVGDTGEFGGGSNHTNAPQHIQFDWNSVLYGNHAYVVGTMNEVRQYALSQPDPYNRISWKFNSTNNRGRFWFHNCKDGGFPTSNDGITIQTKVDGNYELNWPQVSIAPSSVQNIVIHYKATAGTGNASLYFGHPGQTDIQVAGQFVDFDFIKDGNEHSVVIPVSQHGSWAGSKINTLYVQFHNSSQSSTQTIKWINTVDADPEP